MNCPLCNQILSERGCFCSSCGSQARCTKCRELLEPNARACVECGKLVEVGGSENRNDVPLPKHTPTSTKNTLTYHEDRSTRRFEAALTDDAIRGLGGVFGDLFLQRGAARTSATQRQFSPTAPILDAIDPFLTRLPEVASQSLAGEQVSADPLPTNPDRVRLLRIFSPKGDSFELTDNRLKAASFLDYVRRLAYVFLYAHECYGRPAIPEAQLKDLLKAGKAWDSSANANRWVNKRIGISADGDDGIKLTVKGREDAVRTLNEALDPNIPDKWNPDKKTAKPAKKKS